MTVAVTGATGHLGANLVRALIGAGRRVKVLIRGERESIAGLDLEKVKGDVGDPDSLRKLYRNAEVVYHLAAQISITGPQGGRVSEVNVGGVRNSVDAALECGVGRFIHFSSVHAFDLSPGPAPVDEDRPRPGAATPAYDRSKAVGEREVRSAIDRGLDAVIMNPAGCIGPHDFGPSRMGQVLLDLYHRRLPGLIDGGFHWVDTRDVAAAALAAETRGRTGENYLLSGAWRSVSEIAAMAQQVTGVRAPAFCTPMWLARVGAPFMTAAARLTGKEPLYTGEALHALRQCRELSTRKARQELGFEARPIEQTVADTYGWFDEAGRVGSAGGAGRAGR